jgi:hypothetical protein
VINSVVGQNLPWVQLAAFLSPPVAQSAQSDGSTFNNVGTRAADASVVSPVTGSTSAALSSDISLTLLMLGSGSATGSGSPTGTGLSGGSGPAAQTVGSPDDTPTQSATGLESMLASLQSLMATLTGGASAASSGTSPAANSIFQDLDGVLSNVGTLVASTNGPQATPSAANGTSSAPPSGGNDITNTGSVDYASWGDGPAGAGGGWLQQFATTAYERGTTSGVNTASAALLQGISV